MIKYILIAVLSYLLGSVSVAVLLTKKKYRSDVRMQGSGNAGTTNVARVFGMKAGLVTLFGDALKTLLSGGIGFGLAGSTGLAVGAAFCLIGHCWPVYFGFKGGKGVSVSACIALLLDWRLFFLVVGRILSCFPAEHNGFNMLDFLGCCISDYIFSAEQGLFARFLCLPFGYSHGLLPAQGQYQADI